MLADDPLFGRTCFGGEWKVAGGSIEVIPKDGVRRRFHALLGGHKLHVLLANDRFAADKALTINESMTRVGFHLESDTAAPHMVRVSLQATRGASYALRTADFARTVSGKGDEDIVIEVPVAGRDTVVSVSIAY